MSAGQGDVEREINRGEPWNPRPTGMVSVDSVLGTQGEPIHQDVFFASQITLVLLGLVAMYSIYANRLSMKRAREGHEADAIFVGNRDLGLSETMMASFSPLFGGAVLVLLPVRQHRLRLHVLFRAHCSWLSCLALVSACSQMEVAWKGLGVGCRWFSFVGAMGIPCFILNPMIRTLAIERGHISPLELVQDRYRSHMLSVLLLSVILASLIIGCGTQLLAVKSLLLALTNDRAEAQVGTILVCVVATFCDVFGGFRGVARIDALQMVTTIACAAAVALLVVYEWGGLAGVTPPQCPAGQPGATSFQAQSLMCQLNATGYPCVNGCAVPCAKSEPIECAQIASLSASAVGTSAVDSEGVVFDAVYYEAEWFSIEVNANGVEACSMCNAFSPQCVGCYSNAWIFDSAVAGNDLSSSNATTAGVDFALLVRQPHAWQGDYAVWKVFGLVCMVAVGGHGGSMAPHVFQRVVSADSDKTLKRTLLPVFPAGWVTLLAGLIYGVTWMAVHGPEFNYADDGTVLPGAMGPKQPLAGIFDDLIDLGGVAKLFGLVGLSAATASLLTAACMTSMGCGSVFAVGIVRDVLWPIMQWGDARGDLKKKKQGTSDDDDDADDEVLTLDSQIVILSKLVSTLCLFIALATIIFSDDRDLSEMFDWTVGLSAHATPTFWYSGANIFFLGRRVHSIALSLGLVFGLMGSAIIQFYILSPDENDQMPELILPAAAWGVLINWVFTIWFVVTIPGSLADTRQNRPKPEWLAWDAPTPQFLRKYGKNFLTFNEAERICTTHAIPSHQAPVAYGALIAWVITVATLPWDDGGGESTAGRYMPPSPSSDEYMYGLPLYAVIQIGGAFVTMPMYIALVYKFWEAPDVAVSGKLGAISVKPMIRMTAQDVSNWLFQYHQDERPIRDSDGNLQSLAWGLVLDHYIDVFRRCEVDGHKLNKVSKSKLSVVSALVEYGVADQDHAMCLANEIHVLKAKGWVTEDMVYSREWESKLKKWSRDPLDKFGCANALTPRQLNGPKTVSFRDAKRASVAGDGGVADLNASADEGAAQQAFARTHYSIGRLDVVDRGDGDVVAGRANPLQHDHSTMYLRWDPYGTDRATILAEAAWTNLLERLKIGNEATKTSWLLEEPVLLSAEDGMDRAKFLFEFEKLTQPWEQASEHTVPWTPSDITRRSLTYMLHSKALLSTSSISDESIPAGWAVRQCDVGNCVQGRLSRTAPIRCKYHDETGASKPGPGSLVAKFLPRQREFLAERRDNGAGGLNVFGTEVAVYRHELMTDLGIKQPKCFFEAHDPERDCFCILMEDLQAAGFSSGETLSELGELNVGESSRLPSLTLYAEVVRVLADSNSRRYNTSQGMWTSLHNADFDLDKLLLGFDSHAYLAIMYRQLQNHFSVADEDTEEDEAFQNVGFKQLCSWLGYTEGLDKCYTSAFERGVLWMLENQQQFRLASRSREDGGWLDCSIVHGDCRIDNIWFPTPSKQNRDGASKADRFGLRAIDGQCVRFIDFQHVKRACVAYDVTVFLAHSVPTEWRRQNELQLLSLYFDAVKATQAYTEWVGSHAGEELTWEMFLLEVQFCLLHYMPSHIVTAATTVSPFESIDPKRFYRGGAFVRRFLEMLNDWSPSSRANSSQSPIQMIIDAAARRSRDVEEQRQQAGWTQTGNKWTPPDGSTEDADWTGLRAKWVQEAMGSENGESLIPGKLMRGYISRARREDAASRLERFSALDQDGMPDDKTIAADEEAAEAV